MTERLFDTESPDTRELSPGLSVHLMVLHPPIDRLAALVLYLLPHVSEIIIIDTGSTDETVSIMRSWNFNGTAPVHVFSEVFEDFSTTRNKGLIRHQYEWTLGIDPDEWPSLDMLHHIKYAVSSDGMRENPEANGWVYWTFNFWGGILGPEMDYHWHTRLWKTKGSFLYRPIHELVNVCGRPELDIRGSSLLPFAPKQSYLIHSKGSEDIEKADKLYARMGEVSR